MMDGKEEREDLNPRGKESFSGDTMEKTFGIKTPFVDNLKLASDDNIDLALRGVDHSARPTWKLRETVVFYRDVLGLPLVHAITARGWGPADHEDFLHFFFDAGNGATIAFFYYIGSEQPDYCFPRQNHYYNATHTAWAVDSREELVQWKEALEARGIKVSPYTRHEILESIYFVDPNGYPLEVTLRLRDLVPLDREDASMTLNAAIELEDELMAQDGRLQDIDSVWRRKMQQVDAYHEKD